MLTMTGGGNATDKGPTQRSVELGMALAIGAFGILVIYGSLIAGIGWGFEGPKAGFFPFYIGLIILGATVVNLITIVRNNEKRLFADTESLWKVTSVALPTAVFIALIYFLGMYVSGALLIAYFMLFISKYKWLRTALVAILVPLVTFIVFERWFLVALPKGPLEQFLGY
jgi:putative tricarboxylic transport membrane protein